MKCIFYAERQNGQKALLYGAFWVNSLLRKIARVGLKVRP